jgi:hypothetical protein
MLVFNPTPCPSALLDRYADPKPLPYERPISSSGQGSAVLLEEFHFAVETLARLIREPSSLLWYPRVRGSAGAIARP